MYWELITIFAIRFCIIAAARADDLLKKKRYALLLQAENLGNFHQLQRILGDLLIFIRWCSEIDEERHDSFHA